MNKFRKCILPAIWHTLPLTLLTFILFTVMFVTGFYYAIIIPILFTIFVVYRIADDYLDYIVVSDDKIIVNIARGLYHGEPVSLERSECNISLSESLWQKVFGLGTVSIQSEGKTVIMENLIKFKQLKLLLNN